MIPIEFSNTFMLIGLISSLRLAAILCDEVTFVGHNDSKMLVATSIVGSLLTDLLFPETLFMVCDISERGELLLVLEQNFLKLGTFLNFRNLCRFAISLVL